ncbi:MAG: 4Fe-4S dicluster domain-containing protein [Aestuariibacter sp.]
MDKVFLPRSDLASLYQALTDEGYQVIGPQVKNGAILYEPLDNIEQLPWGQQEEVEAGRYTLVDSEKSRCFSWNTGPQSLKPWLFKPTQMLWTAETSEDGFRFKMQEPEAKHLAFLGVRSCDIAALYLQDKHFMHGSYPDPWYTEQRKKLCLVAVNCSRSASTCFCCSTEDGPEATYGFDILLDELDDGYLILAKSGKGSRVMSNLKVQASTEEQRQQATQQIQTAAQQQRKMPDGKSLLKIAEHLNDTQWLQIAERCLACGNCTSVCPTCFCSKQESQTEINTEQHQQVRYWDSCFSEKHSYMGGKHIRGEISQRYRQWLLHKLVTWQEQYQRSGCVGCGRCISWCPAAIDIVEEVNLMLGVDVGE